MINDYFKLALGSIKHRQLRSWLTILGIVLGIALIVTMLSLGEGMKNAVSQQLSRFGPDLLYVFPGDEANILGGFIGGSTLTKNDVDTVKKVKGVVLVVPLLLKQVTIKFANKDKTTLIHGMPAKDSEKFLKDFQGWTMAEGKWFTGGSSDVAVGYRLAKEGFKVNDKGKEINVNQKIEINGGKFTVSGIIGLLGEREHDFTVYMDLDKLRDLTGVKEEVSAIDVKASPGVNPDDVAANIKKELKRTRNAEDFSVLTSARLGSIAGGIIGVIETVLIGLAAVALIVGGIGIMNTSYTGVLERTRQIGVMKAIGARNKDILFIFLIEAGIIGFLGGSLGVLLGSGVAKLVEFIAHQNGLLLLNADISWSLILFGLGFSFVVGCVAGILPAMQAAKLKPVDALRYE